MKKLIVTLVLFFVITSMVSAWEPSDLTTFPSCMEADDWILNFGVGIGNFSFIGRDYIWLPLMRLTFDRNVALGEQELPFLFGGLVGFSGQGHRGWKDHNGRKYGDYFIARVPVGFRVGYHFNWGIDNLDTYAVTTGGSTLNFGNNAYWGVSDWIFVSVNVGARYFVSDNFGFWAEIGWNHLSILDLGVSFKF